MGKDRVVWDFLGKTLVVIVLYCLMMVVCAAIFLPLTLVVTGIAIVWTLKWL